MNYSIPARVKRIIARLRAWLCRKRVPPEEPKPDPRIAQIDAIRERATQRGYTHPGQLLDDEELDDMIWDAAIKKTNRDMRGY